MEEWSSKLDDDKKEGLEKATKKLSKLRAKKKLLASEEE